jgi:rhodanese-related sulfurtransferase
LKGGGIETGRAIECVAHRRNYEFNLRWKTKGAGEMKILKMIVPMSCVLVMFASAGLSEDAPATVPDISLTDLKKAIADKNVVLVDCNGSKSYANGHIPGAIDFEVAKDTLAQSLPKDKAALVVAYCGGSKCGAYKAGADAATKLGYTNVKHFSGGISGWKTAGEKVEAADVVKQ